MNIFKRFISAFLILVMIVPFMIGATTIKADARVIFSDITEDYVYIKAIYKLLDEGIMDGYNLNGEYRFHPGDAVQRAEAIRLIVTTFLEEDPSKLSPKSKFTDVPDDHWANRYIAYATDANIIAPVTSLTFEPEKPITYGEVIKMLVCAKGYASMYRNTEPWYDGYLTLANQLGLNENVFPISGDANIPRAVLAQLIYNAKFAPTIPKLYIYGNISNIKTKKDERKIQVKYDNGVDHFFSYATVKAQGTSSLQYAKKNFTLTFYEDANATKKRKFDMGWGKESKYCLKANWIDKTHSRNVVTARLAAQMQGKYNIFTTAPNNGTVDGFPVEIYNNGAFYGIYTFNIPKDEWMFDMDKDDPNHILVGGEGWEKTNLFTAKPNFTDWELEVGKDNNETLSKLTRMFDFVINSSDETFKKDFDKYLNLDSTLNYYIMADMAYLADNLGKNMLIATYDGQIWYPTLYDLDSSWGVHYDGNKLFPYEQNPLSISYNNLFSRIEKCFGKELSDRYLELSKTVLSKNNIMFNFKSFENSIPQYSFARETVKWGTQIPGFDISQIERYLDVIIPRLNEKYIAMQ